MGMINMEKVIRHITAEICIAKTCKKDFASVDIDMLSDALELLKEQEAIVRCWDCRHWDKTTRKEGSDCILGHWEDAVCDIFRDWDTYGDLGEDFRRKNGDWFCADGEKR